MAGVPLKIDVTEATLGGPDSISSTPTPGWKKQVWKAEEDGVPCWSY